MPLHTKRNRFDIDINIEYNYDDEEKFYKNYNKYSWSYAKTYLEYENIIIQYDFYKKNLINNYYDNNKDLSNTEIIDITNKDKYLNYLLNKKINKKEELDIHNNNYVYYYNYYI